MNSKSVTTEIQTRSVMVSSAQPLAAVGVGHRQGEKADGNCDEDQIQHGVAPQQEMYFAAHQREIRTQTEGIKK